MEAHLQALEKRFLEESLPELNAELSKLGYHITITSIEEAEQALQELNDKINDLRAKKMLYAIGGSVMTGSAKNDAHDLVMETENEVAKLEAQRDKINETLSTYKYEKEQVEFMYMYGEYESMIAQDTSKEFSEYIATVEGFNSEFSMFNIKQYGAYKTACEETGKEVSDYRSWYAENYVNNYNEFINQKYEEWKVETYYSTENLKDKQALEFLDKTEISTYNYLYEVVGKEAAEDYLDFMNEELNRREGEKEAQEYLAKLDGSGSDYLYTTAEGFSDGLVSFKDGLVGWIVGDEDLDVSDYKTMYILQEISNNEKYKPFMDDVYQISSSIGNMAIPVIASTAVGIVSKTAGIQMASSFATLSNSGKILKAVSALSSVSFGVSAGGNAYDQALESGNGKLESMVYGVGIGTSDMLLERFLGGIPGLSKGSSNIIVNMAKEGGEEWTQTFVETFLSCALLKDKFTEVDWGEKLKEANQAGIYGILTAGVMNGASMTLNGIVYTATDLNALLNTKKPAEYFKSLVNSEVKVDFEDTNQAEANKDSIGAEIDVVYLESQKTESIKDKVYKNMPSNLNQIETASFI